MKVLSSLLASALLAVSAGAAMADTFTIGSYGTLPGTTGYTAPSSFQNTALTYNGGATYDLPTGGVWSSPSGGSSWVGINPQDYPGGSHVEPNGTYTYSTTFTASAGQSIDLTVMADDTTSVDLNGVLVLSPSSFTQAAHCVAGLPTCTAKDEVTISGLVAGVNTLSFGVDQMYKAATGVDFSGTVGVTPEPSSLLLLGSGLTSMAGIAMRRRRQA